MTRQLVSIGNGVELRETSLALPPGLTEQRWAEIAMKISHAGIGYWWWIGDLAHYASHNFENSTQKLASLASASGIGGSYIKMLAKVARSYPVRERVPALSVSHHVAVVDLPGPKRRRALQLAKRHSWPIRKMIERVTPKQARELTFIITVPLSKRVMAERMAQAFAKSLGGRYRIWGSVRRSSARRKHAWVASA